MKRFLISGLILIILAAGILYFWSYFFWSSSQLEFLDPVRNIISNGVEVEITPPKVAKLADKKVSTPPPLRAAEEKETPQAILSKPGVIKLTNIERGKYGLSPLKENAKLNETAKTKLQDMFENQYFSHDSPTGEGVADLAENFTYQFLAIGENLALGNFQNDKILVEGWMASPGHRANILNSTYQEIGVAVRKGIFEGKTTWLAVQHFGLPLSVCSQPDLIIKAKIDENQRQILELQRELFSLETEIQTMRPRRGTTYTQKIEQYNDLVSQYNALVEENKRLINEYNSQVNLFNQCVAVFSIKK